MKFNNWEACCHANWDDLETEKNNKERCHYFVKSTLEQTEEWVGRIEDSLSIKFPAELFDFCSQLGMGQLCINNHNKKGRYNILLPVEIYDVYFPDEEEDLFISYRLTARENLDKGLLAFCIFGDEDSLIYVNVNDQCVYYNSIAHKIANSIEEFLEQLTKKADYFI